MLNNMMIGIISVFLLLKIYNKIEIRAAFDYKN